MFEHGRSQKHTKRDKSETRERVLNFTYITYMPLPIKIVCLISETKLLAYNYLNLSALIVFSFDLLFWNYEMIRKSYAIV